MINRTRPNHEEEKKVTKEAVIKASLKIQIPNVIGVNINGRVKANAKVAERVKENSIYKSRRACLRTPKILVLNTLTYI